VTSPPRVHPEAVSEIEETAAWYEARRPGLGVEFVAAVDEAFESLMERPERAPLWKAGLPWRRYRLSRFPYVLFYRVDVGQVFVIALAHAKRRPGYWTARGPP
jgi:toxin ParE1/3/4